MRDSPTQPRGRHEVMDSVLDLVARTVDANRVRIMPDTSLLSSAERFDSFALLELVVRLEGAFNLSIPDEDLDSETFSSPRAIASYLFERLQAETTGGI